MNVIKGLARESGFSLRHLFISATVLAASAPAHSLNIVLSDLGGAAPGSDAYLGFTEAANIWESHFTDNITVNLSVKFGSDDINGNPYGGSTLGSTGARQISYGYSAFRGALTADAKSASDTMATSNLQSGNTFQMLINRTLDSPNGAGSATPYLDADGGSPGPNINNNTVRINAANAKALGLQVSNPTGSDASIGFNSAFAFDFDRSDGIMSGEFDFVGTALHEIGHALGFISGVDVLDFNSSDPYFAENSLRNVSPLDLFRFSALSVAEGAGTIDWTADTRAKYFSIDGGASDLGGFSTGVTHGDGRQASHWKDSQNLGLMDPTISKGQLFSLSSLDLQAVDVIGYDMAVAVAVPLPAGAWLFGSGLAGLFSLARRRRAQAAVRKA